MRESTGHLPESELEPERPHCLVQGSRYCPDPKLISDSRHRAAMMERHFYCPPRNWANPALPSGGESISRSPRSGLSDGDVIIPREHWRVVDRWWTEEPEEKLLMAVESPLGDWVTLSWDRRTREWSLVANEEGAG